jgi:hypothetical protein
VLPYFKVLVDQIMVALAPVLPQIAEAMSQLAIALVQILLALTPLIPPFLQLVLAILPSITGLIQGLVPILNFLAVVLGKILGNPVVQFFAGIAAQVAVLVFGAGKVTKAFGAFSKTLGVLKTAFFKLSPVVQSVLGLLGLGGFISVLVAIGANIKDIVIAALKLLANTFITVADGIISGAAKAFGWVPGIGGKLKKANREFDEFAAGVRASLDGIPDVTTVAIQPVVLPPGKAFGPVLPGQDLPDALPPGYLDKLYSGQIKASTGDINLSGVGGGNTAAQDAAEDFRKTVKGLLEQIDRDFRKTLIEGTADQIDKQLYNFRVDVVKAFKEAGKPVPNGFVDLISKANSRLKKLANEREAILKKLEDATNRATEVANSVRSFADLTSAQFEDSTNAAANAVKKLNIATLDTAGSFQVVSRTLEQNAEAANTAVKRTAQDFADNLQDRLNAIIKFRRDIETLVKRGLDKNIIDDIISAGVDGGAATAAALASGSTGTISQINKIQKQIEENATALGDTAADSLYRSGQQAVAGLIDGLKERKSEITEAMEDIADDLIKAIRKKLKIQSPSKVMFQMGGFTGQGYVDGLKSMRASIRDVAKGMGGDAIPRTSGVTFGGAGGRGQDSFDYNRLAGIVGSGRKTEVHAPITINTQQPATAVQRQLNMIIPR